MLGLILWYYYVIRIITGTGECGCLTPPGIKALKAVGMNMVPPDASLPAKMCHNAIEYIPSSSGMSADSMQLHAKYNEFIGDDQMDMQCCDFSLPFSDTTYRYLNQNNPFMMFLFVCCLWPGMDILSFLFLVIVRRGALELFVLLGLFLQGVAPEGLKRIPWGCTQVDNMENDFWCQIWKRPETSCLDDCGMPSGHTCVAYFYLGWGVPYLMAWHRRRSQAPLAQPLLNDAERGGSAGSGGTERSQSSGGETEAAVQGSAQYIISDALHYGLGIFFFLQGPIIIIVGDHTILQTVLGGLTGF